MSPSDLTHPRPFDDPALLPFLPMLYVAWADGDLEADEMGEICHRLDGDCARLLGPWLDPAQPPSASELAQLLGLLRRLGEALEKPERLSLAGLGLELAQAGGRTVREEERRALETLEEVLGVAGSEAARQLLTSRRPAVVPEPPDPAFDVVALGRFLDGDRHTLRQRVRALLAQPAFQPPADADRETYREWVLGVCHRLAEEGLGALSYPEEAGGQADLAGFIATFETLATGDLSVLVKFGVQFGLFGGSILNLGTERHHREYLPAVGRLELPGCFAMTETGHGSNVQDLETVARWDTEAGDFVLRTPHAGARKDYIGNAARHGRMATVFAQLEVGEESHGVHAFLVPIRDQQGRPLPGIHIEDCGAKMGLEGVDNGRLGFDGVRVPRANLLDRFASVDAEGRYSSPIPSPNRRFFTMLGTLVGGRVSVALGGLSVAKSALTIALRYSDQRRQFGPPDAPERLLLDYQTHQLRLLPRLATTYALHFALDDLRHRYAAAGPGDDLRPIEARAAGLKAYATWHATDTVQTCREGCGGQGYLAVNRFAALKADSDVFTTFEGDNVVLLQLVAKGLLTGYRRQFQNLGQNLSFSGLLRFVAGWAGARLEILDPVTPRRTDPDHLRHRDTHRGAFTWRAQHQLSSVARRLKRRLDRGLDPTEALVEVQGQLVETALSHVELWLLEQFHRGIDGCPDPKAQRELERLASLWAISRLTADRGWFLEHGYFEPPKARALRQQRNRLCAELRPQALPLVDAFQLSPEVLRAPIAG